MNYLGTRKKTDLALLYKISLWKYKILGETPKNSDFGQRKTQLPKYSSEQNVTCRSVARSFKEFLCVSQTGGGNEEGNLLSHANNKTILFNKQPTSFFTAIGILQTLFSCNYASYGCLRSFFLLLLNLEWTLPAILEQRFGQPWRKQGAILHPKRKKTSGTYFKRLG